MVDISDVAMEPHHIIRDRISQAESIEGSEPTYASLDDEFGAASAPGLPLPQGGE